MKTSSMLQTLAVASVALTLSSAAALAACAKGQHFNEATLTCRLDSTGQPTSGGAIPLEQVSFNFQTISLSYTKVSCANDGGTVVKRNGQDSCKIPHRTR